MDKIKDFTTDRPLLIIFLITAFGGLLRLYHLGFKSLWFDEAVLYWISNGNTLKDVITKNALSNSTPLLFPVLIRFISTLGDSEEMLRLIPFIAGTASIPAIYLLSHELINLIPSFILTLVVSVAPTQIKYSQELREYSLTFLLSILIILFFLRFLKRKNQKDLFLMTIFMILGILTQYGLSLLIISLNLIFLYTLIANKEKRRERLFKWVSSQVFTLMTAGAVVFVSLRGQSNFFNASRSPNHYLYNAYWDGSIRSLLDFTFKNTFGLIRFAFSSNVFIFLTIIGCIFLIINNKKYANLLLIIFTPIIFTLIFAILGLYPYNGERQVIFLTPMVYVLAGFGIDYIWGLDKKRLATIILFSFTIITGLVQSWNYLNAAGIENLNPVVDKLKNEFEEEDHVYVYYGAKPAFNYYTRDYELSNIYYGTRNREKINIYLNEVDDILHQSDSVWFVFSHCWKNECKLITNHIAKANDLELIIEDNSSYLYFVGE